MELNEFRPYKFDQIAPIFDLHLSQLMLHLHRMRFTQTDYLRRTVPLNWRSLRRVILCVLFKWSIVVTLFCAYLPQKFPLFRGFCLALSRTLDVPDVTFFVGIFQILMMALEYVSLYSLRMQLKYRNTKLEVIYDMRSKLDRELPPASHRRLIAYFVRYSYLAGLGNKISAILDGAFMAMLTVKATKLWLSGAIDTSQYAIAIFYLAAFCWYIFDGVYIAFTLLTGLFFIVKVLRIKMLKCIMLTRAMGYAASGNQAEMSEQSGQMASIVSDYMIQQELRRATLHLGLDHEDPDGSYSANNIRYKRDRVAKVSREVMPSNHNLHSRQKSISIFRFVVNRQKQSKRFSAIKQKSKRAKTCKSEIHFLQKLSFMHEFVPNARMGFSNGELYLIDQSTMLQAVMVNFYMIALLSKKLHI